MRRLGASRQALCVLATLCALLVAPPPGFAAEPATFPPAPVAPAPGAPGAPAEPTAGYQFATGKTTLYAYDLTQDVSWQSAGDTLNYHSTVGWEFSLSPQLVTPTRCELSVVILHLTASQNGPAGNHAVDSRLPVDRNGRDDPLLGHLLALDGAQLTVVLDPRSGVVAAVRGGEEIVKRINQRFPAAIEGDLPPLDASSREAYGPASLARLWSGLLALPGPAGEAQRVPLGAPLPGELERRWQGQRYTLSLPPGTSHLDGTLLLDPTPVTVSISELAGGGECSPRGGLPFTTGGELRYLITYSALTQPVVQRHQLRWSLRQGR